MRQGRLTGAADWTLEVLGRLQRRLNAPDQAPVAVALSGGGDSLALLHLARLWGERAGRPVVALTVDHRLCPESAAWSRFAAEKARSLGLAHFALVWRGEKPATGLPAAARAARHALLAEAARGMGARVVLMGHTADDALEAQEMRRDGASTPSPREWAPSPLWPEGRDVFLLRPLLGVRRAALRSWLRSLGETWIEDPSNEDARFSRAAARKRLAGGPAGSPPALCEPVPPGLEGVSEGRGGEFHARRCHLMADPGAARRLAAMLLCAAGGQRPPRRERVERLLARLAAPGDIIATLAGARLEARGGEVVVSRDAGERGRGAMAEAALPEGESVFDGRFLIAAPGADYRIAPLSGRAGRLPLGQRAGLRRIAASARGALPVVIAPDETLSCPILAQDGPVTARALGMVRLQAALGGFADEAAFWRVAKSGTGS